MSDVNQKLVISTAVLAAGFTALLGYTLLRTAEPVPVLSCPEVPAVTVQTPVAPATPAAAPAKVTKENLNLWTENAPARTALLAYVKEATNPDSPGYIPPEDRIAVFDLDGTLFCETDPNYFDYTLLLHRVTEDPSYKDRASEFEREVAGKIREQNETGKSFKELPVDHGKAVASAFAGMTLDEFDSYVQEFKKLPMPSYENMVRGGGFYRPMLQVVNLLKENGFTVYIVSGTDRLIVRGLLHNSELKIPNNRIIGSDETLVATGQGTTDGLDYSMTKEDRLVLGGTFIIKNLKMNKVSVIMQEIGQKPVLAFGNSSGDVSMAQFVTTGNKYPAMAFLLAADDLERENGSMKKADQMNEFCNKFSWTCISMKNDWKTIYGEGVTRKKKE